MQRRLRIDQESGQWAVSAIWDDLVVPLGAADSYEAALEVLVASAQYGTIIAAASQDQGLLPEWWTSVEGIAFSEPTGDGRDFSACTWLSRDPEVSLLPLMLQTETEIGHYGAELAGFIEDLTGLGYRGTPDASGRFYATDCGVQARNMLQGGRVFGVSVDPGPATEATFECTEYDPEEGYCTDGVYQFSTYEVIGLTATPFPGFARAAMRLMTPDEQTMAAGEEAAEPMVRMAVAAAGGPVRPSREWFETPEPELGDDRLIPQEGGALAMPFTIGDDGRFMGHLTYWGQCHVGFASTCVSAPESQAAYAHFHVGDLVTEEGDHLAVGTLFAGTDHADISWGAAAAVDHYAHTGFGWGDARVTNGVFGAWACGALRPGVTDTQLRVLRASTMSGDWRRIGGNLEMVAALSVNSGGFPLVREVIAASGLAMVDEPMVKAKTIGRVVTALTAASVVRRCPECARRASLAARLERGVHQGWIAVDHKDQILAGLAGVQSALAVIERRTRHLAPEAAKHLTVIVNGKMPDDADITKMIERIDRRTATRSS